MTANTRKNIIMITVILIMLGIAKSKALTAIFKPSFLPIRRRHLRILKVFTTLKL